MHTLPSPMSKKKTIPMKEAIDMFQNQHMSTREIGERFNCCQTTIRKNLKQHGIKMRTCGPLSPRTIKELSETEASYLAGIIDGEGSIYMQKIRRAIDGVSPTMVVRNTNKKLAKYLMSIGGDINWEKGHFDKRFGTTGKPCFHWYCRRLLDIGYVIRKILPYLVIKREKALLILEEIKKREKLKRVSDYEQK